MADKDIDEVKNILDQISQKYKNSDLINRLKIGEIFPTEYAPVIISNNLNKEPIISKWGFPIKGKKQVIINGRAETLLTKYPFNKLLNQRCLIPAIGFYEWQKTENGKRKLLIRSQNKQLLYMAGLYQRLEIDDEIDAFVIITTAPSSQMKSIHDRMPAILKKEYHDIWLFEKADQRTIKSLFDKLLTPYDNDLDIEPV